MGVAYGYVKKVPSRNNKENITTIETEIIKDKVSLRFLYDLIFNKTAKNCFKTIMMAPIRLNI